MGLCIWRAYECLFPILLNPLPGSAILSTNSPQGQLGMPLGRQYSLSGRVRLFFSPFWLLSSKRFWLKCRFAQYMYGVYLGLNGNVFCFVSLIIIIIIAYLAWLLSTALPFLIRTELLLSPLLPLFASYVVSLLGFNVAKHVLPFYFG